jgi:hypothetical protein
VPAADVNTIVLSGVTVIVPFLVITPQPPVNVIVYGKVPATDGLPLIVTTLPAQPPITPAGNPANVASVAPVVAYVIVAIDEFVHIVCASVPTADVNVIVLLGVTTNLPVLVIIPQPPV